MTLDLSTFSEENSKKYWDNLLGMAFTRFYNSIKEKNEFGIKGMILYFKEILKNFENIGEIPDNHHISFSQDGVEMRFIYTKDDDSRKSKVGYNDRVCDIRLRMAYFYDIPYNKCVLITKKKVFDMSDDFKVFRELVSTNESVEIQEFDPPITRLKVNPKSILLSQVKLYSTLYSLLNDSNSIYINHCWDLINSFPVVKEIENDVLKCDILDKFLSSSSIYYINYNLKLIRLGLFTSLKNKKQIFLNSNDFYNQSQIDVAWISIFCEKQGVALLIKILHNLEFSSNLVFDAILNIAFILKVIYGNIKGDSLNNSDIWNIIQKKELMKLVLEKVNKLVRKSLEFDSSSQQMKEQEYHFTRKERNILKNNSSDIEHSIMNFSPVNVLNKVIIEWENQNQALEKIVEFFDIFELKKTFVDNLSLVSTEFKEILTSGFIKLKNFKIKESLFNFIMNLLIDDFIQENSTSIKLKDFIISELFNENHLFDLVQKNIPQSSKYLELLSKLLDSILKENEIENEKMVTCCRKMLSYVKEFKYSHLEIKNCLVIEGYLAITKVILNKNEKIKSIIEKEFSIIDFLLKQCIMSKCQSKLVYYMIFINS